MIVILLLARAGLLAGLLLLIGHVLRGAGPVERRRAAAASVLLLLLLAPLTLCCPSGLLALRLPAAESASPAGLAGTLPAFPWARAAVDLLLAGYVAGLAVGLLRLTLAWNRLARLDLRPAPTPAQRLLAHICPVRRHRPRLAVSRDSSQPFATGWGFGRRGLIVLPATLVGATDTGTLAAILRHEVRHLWSADPAWAALSRLTCLLFWPIPFVHRLNRRLEEIHEEQADRAAVEGRPLPERALYAESLIALAERAGRTGWSRAAVTVCRAIGAAGRSAQNLERRIRAILALRPGSSAAGLAAGRRLRPAALAGLLLALPSIFAIGERSAVGPPTAPIAAVQDGHATPAGQATHLAALAPDLAQAEAAIRAEFQTGRAAPKASLSTEESRLRAGM